MTRTGGADGRPAIFVIARDVSDRLAAEAALRRMATAIENAAEGFFIIDGQGIIEKRLWSRHHQLDTKTRRQQELVFGHSAAEKPSSQFGADLTVMLWIGETGRGKLHVSLSLGAEGTTTINANHRRH